MVFGRHGGEPADPPARRRDALGPAEASNFLNSPPSRPHPGEAKVDLAADLARAGAN
jgi:hypothetical protein